MQNYFSLFELPQIFDIDLTALEKTYFAAQRNFHPDRFIGKSAPQRQEAIRQSMRINEGYETLKTPLKRAQYLLKLAGVAQDSVKPSQELLMEIMELREALSEADLPAKLTEFSDRNKVEIAALFAELTEAFCIPDYDRAAQLTMRLSYLTKMGGEIRIRAKVIAGAE